MNRLFMRDLQACATLSNYRPHTRSWSRGKRLESARRHSLWPFSKLNTRNEGWSPPYHRRLVDTTLRSPAAKLPTAHSWRPFTCGSGYQLLLQVLRHLYTIGSKGFDGGRRCDMRFSERVGLVVSWVARSRRLVIR
jgi:hypothetical protein